MNIKRGLAATLLCILPLTACASHTAETTAKKTHATSSPSQNKDRNKITERNETAYTTVVRNLDLSQGVADQRLIELGDSICGALKRGATKPQIMASLMETYSYTESGSLLAAADVFLCPK